MPAISESAMAGDRLAAGKRREVVARLAKYFFSYKWRVLTAFFLMLGSNAFALIGPWLSGLAVDAIALEGGRCKRHGEPSTHNEREAAHRNDGDLPPLAVRAYHTGDISIPDGQDA